MSAGMSWWCFRLMFWVFCMFVSPMAAFVYFLLLASEFRSSSVIIDITLIKAFTECSLDSRSFKHLFNSIFAVLWYLMIIVALAVIANCVYASLAMNVTCFYVNCFI